MATTEGDGGVSSLAGANSSNSNRCVDTAISLPENVGRLVVNSISLILVMLVAFLWHRARRRIFRVQQILPWYTFGVLHGIAVIFYILDILLTVFGSCYLISASGIAGIGVPASLARGIADALLLYIILTSVTDSLIHDCRGARAIKYMKVGGLGLVILSLLPWIVVQIMANVYTLDSSLDASAKDLVASLRVYFTLIYHTTYFCIVIISSLILAHALIRPFPDQTINSTRRKITTALTSTLLLTSAGTAVAADFTWLLPSRHMTAPTFITFFALFSLTFVLTLLSLVLTAETFAVPAISLMDLATYDPEEEGQAGVRKRFTYTGAVEVGTKAGDGSQWPLGCEGGNGNGGPRWPLSSPTRATFGMGGGESPRQVQHAF